MSQQDSSSQPAKKGANAKKGGWKKPKDKPKRPLSAYNIFFQYERDLMLRNMASPFGHDHSEHHSTLDIPPSVRKDKSKRARPPPHGKIGFAELAKLIGARWKSLSTEHRAHFQGLAAIEKRRYNREVEEWQRKKDAEEAGVETPDNNEKVQDRSHEQYQNETVYDTLNQAYGISDLTSQRMAVLPQPPTSMTMNDNTYYIGAKVPTANYSTLPPYYGPETASMPSAASASNMNAQQHCWRPNFPGLNTSIATTSGTFSSERYMRPEQVSSRMNLQEHSKGQKLAETSASNDTTSGAFSAESTVEQTEQQSSTSSKGAKVEDGDILSFLNKLVSD